MQSTPWPLPVLTCSCGPPAAIDPLRDSQVQKRHGFLRTGEFDGGRQPGLHAEPLPLLDDALALLLIDTRDLLETMMSRLHAGELRPDVHRNLLHLCSRMDGLAWQMEEAIQIVERLAQQDHTERGRLQR